MQLDTLSVVDLAMKRDAVAANFDPNQSVAAWTHIRKLFVASVRSLDLWIGKAAPLCESISKFTYRPILPHLQRYYPPFPARFKGLKSVLLCLDLPATSH